MCRVSSKDRAFWQMATIMTDKEGQFPTTSERPSAINCATVKNRMETRRLVETLEALDKHRARSLRRIQSMQEFLLNSRRQPNITANGKRKISESTVSFSTVEAETGGESPSHVRTSTLPSLHVQGRSVDEEGVEATFTKSVVCLENLPDSPHAGQLEFPPFAETQKAGGRTKEAKVYQQKSKQRMSSGTFLLIPEIQNHFRKGTSQKPLTPPFQSGRDRLRFASDPTALTTYPPRSPMFSQHNLAFGRSRSFSGLTSATSSSPLNSSISTQSYKNQHQRLQATGSFDRPLRTASSYIKDEFGKLSLADQIEAIKGSRYLRIPPAGRTSPK